MISFLSVGREKERLLCRVRALKCYLFRTERIDLRPIFLFVSLCCLMRSYQRMLCLYIERLL